MANMIDAFRGQLSPELFNAINSALNKSLTGINNTFTYRPGGTTDYAQNIYSDWATMMSVMSAMQGKKTIWFDGRFAPDYGQCVIPAGTWDMAETIWENDMSFFACFNIVFAQGCKITNMQGFSLGQNGVNCILVNDSTDPVFDDYGNFSFTLINMYRQGMISNPGKAPIFAIPDVSDFALLVLFLRAGDTCIGEPSTAPTVSLDPVVRAGVNGNVVIQFNGGGQLSENALAGPGFFDINLVNGPFEVNYSTVQPQVVADGGVLFSTSWSGPRFYSDYAPVADGGTLPYGGFVKYEPSGAGETVVLPSAATRYTIIVVKNIGSDPLTVVRPVGETIDRAASDYVLAAGDVVRFSPDAGTNWETW